MSTITEQVQSFWDIDAATYDRSSSHNPQTALELAVWSAALRRLLPPPPAKVLDVGSGTGFLALLLARQGYEVTALDLSPGMLGRLQEKAKDAGLEVKTVHGDAGDPPVSGFDAVVERHLLWTLPAPKAALEAWYRSAPDGRLLLLEGMSAKAGGRAEKLRRLSHATLQRLRKTPPDHHAEYAADLRSHLPLSGGFAPETVVALVESTSWGPARVERLPDVEWAARLALLSSLDRLFGVSPRYAVVAR